MRGVPSSKVQGEVGVSLIGESVIECRGVGYLRRTEVAVAQVAIERILKDREGPFDSLFDGSAIDGYEIGLPMYWVRWAFPLIHRFQRFAVVGRAGAMLAVARPFQYLFPTLSVGLFESRHEALAFLSRTRPER